MTKAEQNPVLAWRLSCLGKQAWRPGAWPRPAVTSVSLANLL